MLVLPARIGPHSASFPQQSPPPAASQPLAMAHKLLGDRRFPAGAVLVLVLCLAACGAAARSPRAHLEPTIAPRHAQAQVRGRLGPLCLEGPAGCRAGNAPAQP